jgi:hypothetical protein
MEVAKVDRSEEYGGMPKWKAILEGYHTDYILIAPLLKFSSQLDLAYALASDADWKLIYSDDLTLIFARNKAELRDIIGRYQLPSELVYAVTARQALWKVASEDVRSEKVRLYLIAADAFVRLNRREDVAYCVRKALEADPGDPQALSYARSLGIRTK